MVEACLRRILLEAHFNESLNIKRIDQSKKHGSCGKERFWKLDMKLWGNDINIYRGTDGFMPLRLEPVYQVVLIVSKQLEVQRCVACRKNNIWHVENGGQRRMRSGVFTRWWNADANLYVWIGSNGPVMAHDGHQTIKTLVNIMTIMNDLIHTRFEV
jgi:hypothetical protein